MGILAWIVVGLIAGWLARMAVPGREPGGLLATLLIGVIGAIVGGWVAGLLGYGGATGINVWSIVVALVGAVIFLLIWNAVVVRRPA